MHVCMCACVCVCVCVCVRALGQKVPKAQQAGIHHRTQAGALGAGNGLTVHVCSDRSTEHEPGRTHHIARLQRLGVVGRGDANEPVTSKVAAPSPSGNSRPLGQTKVDAALAETRRRTERWSEIIRQLSNWKIRRRPFATVCSSTRCVAIPTHPSTNTAIGRGRRRHRTLHPSLPFPTGNVALRRHAHALRLQPAQELRARVVLPDVGEAAAGAALLQED